MDHEHKHSQLRPETTAVNAGRPAHVPGAPVNFPIGMSTTFHAGDPQHGYIREGTVGTESFEATLGALEGGISKLFGSGVGAINAALDLVPAGGIVVVPNHAYPGTLGRARELAAAGRIQLREVLISDTAAVATACADAAMLWLETPTNPLMEIADIRAGVAAAKKSSALVVVDNTFMSPARQKPLELGADISMHSATKSIAGHSDSLLGVLTTNREDIAEKLHSRRLLLGAFPGALETYLGLRGLRTLFLRYGQAEANAAELAARLSSHPNVKLVRYPGLTNHPGHSLHMSQATGGGHMVCFEITGDAAEADRICETTQIITHATSLGGVESTIERRRRWGAESLDTPDNLIRFSVGIEHIEDLWSDLKQALN